MVVHNPVDAFLVVLSPYLLVLITSPPKSGSTYSSLLHFFGISTYYDPLYKISREIALLKIFLRRITNLTELKVTELYKYKRDAVKTFFVFIYLKVTSL
jgi:hypothetical protein